MPELPADGEMAGLSEDKVLDRLLTLLVDLWVAGEDCRGKVTALATWSQRLDMEPRADLAVLGAE
jgi:hypothetical protein